MRTPGPLSCNTCSKYLLGLAIGLTTISPIAGCRKTAEATVVAAQSGADPAAANLAPVGPNQAQQPASAPARAQPAPARVLGQRLQNESQQRAEEYSQTGAQAGAPPADQANQADQSAQPQNPPYDNTDQAYDDQVDAGQAALEADQPPPQLPVYDQPPAPAPNYLWTPGYWSYAPVGYYWVPGAWVAAPYYGALWTPGYWFFFGNRYHFRHGFWGPHIGYYGGINYGFGYTGYGYEGGYWNGNRFYYNRAVNRVNVTNITNVYNRTVIVNNNTRVSYNGGRGGINVRPQPAELAAMRGPRTPPMTAQLENQRQAAQNRAQFYSDNRGRPAIVASPRPFTADRDTRPQTRPVPANQPETRTIQPANPDVSRPAQPQIQANHSVPQPNVRPATPQQPRPEIRPAQPQNYPAPVNSAMPQQHPNQELRPIQPQSDIRPQQPHSDLTPPNQTVRPTFNRGIVEPTPQRPQPEVRPTPQPRPTPEIRPAPQSMMRPAYQPPSQPKPMLQPQPQPHQMQQQPRPSAPPQSHQQSQPHGDDHHPR
ncbi:MAG TPA: hypothetical protein VIX90_16065 [Edaphobacter sp.]